MQTFPRIRIKEILPNPFYEANIVPLALSAPQGRQEALGTRPSSCRAWRGAQETEGVPSGLAVGSPVGRDGLSSGFLRALGLAETRSCFSWGAVRYSPPELSVM